MELIELVKDVFYWAYPANSLIQDHCKRSNEYEKYLYQKAYKLIVVCHRKVNGKIIVNIHTDYLLEKLTFSLAFPFVISSIHVLL